jgi:regulatory protein
MTEDARLNFSTSVGKSHQKAMNTAVRILANRDHSKHELKQKLQQRGFAGEIIDTVLAECERLDYINDPRTALQYILQLKRKGFGKRYIRLALKKKHLSGAAVQDLLKENYPAADERENAAKLLEKKRQTLKPEADLQKNRAKMYRFLSARGFNKDVIAEVVRDAVK